MRRKFIDFPIPRLLYFVFSSNGCQVLNSSLFSPEFPLVITNVSYRNHLQPDRLIKMNNEKVKFLLNWNHFGEHLSSCMTKLMTDSSYSDIIIATGDKHMIYSHRFVLANSSKYFQRLFRHVTRQRGIQLVVALPEVKYEIFKILMNYMYKGETQVPHELLPSVIKAGQFLEINGLVNLNENDNSGNGENSKHVARESHSKCPGTDTKQYKRIPSTLRDNIHPRENTHVSPKNVLQQDKTKRQNEEMPSKSPTMEENGKENRSKLTKSLKCKNPSRDKKDIIQLPLKRKSCMREPVKKTSPLPSSSSSSLSSSGCPPKKLHKRRSVSHEIINVKVKEEKENSKSPVEENEKPETQDSEEKITIKMEVPDDIDEVVYNELQCEYCQEVYTNPSDWVRHMTEQHGDRGYQSYKDLDKSVGGNAVITCVVCSSVCFSAAEWAKHLRMWHSERELTLANMEETRKNVSKIKRRSGINKKEQ